MKDLTKPTQVKRTRLLQNNRGAGILVLVVILGFVTFLALSNTMAQSEFSLSRLKLARTKKADSQALRYEMNFILGSRTGCAANLKALSISTATTSTSPVDLTTINYGDVSGVTVKPLLSLKNPLLALYGRVPVKRMSLYAHPTKFGPDGAGTHLSLLEVEMGKPSDSDEINNRNFPFRRTMQIPVYATTDASGVIQSCHSTSYVMKDDTGADVTLEEKLCSGAASGSRTANWPEDCLSCLDSASLYYLCIDCKRTGKTYDPISKTCV